MKKILQIARNLYYYRILDIYKKFKAAFFNPRTKSGHFDRIYTCVLEGQAPVVFDVGAFDGRSIERFRKLFPSAYVHSFEPSSHSFAKISAAYAADKSVSLNKKAVGAQANVLTLHYNQKPDTSSILPVDVSHEWTKRRAKEMGILAEDFSIETEEVNVIALDTYIEENKVSSVDILKIDTQGFEVDVLKGALKSIERGVFKFIEIEVLLHGLYQGTDKDILDYESLIVPNGYKIVATSAHIDILENNVLLFDVVYARQDMFDALSASQA